MAKKLRVKSDPPATSSAAAASDTPFAPKTAFNDQADVRDLLSMIAGGGHTSLGDPEVKKVYGRLSQIVGAPAAQKLANQAFLFGQRPETKTMTPQQRVEGFFSLGSNDGEVAEYLKQGKGMGYGIVDGFRNSPLLHNRQMQGAQPPQTNTAVASTPKMRLKLR